VLHGIPQHGPVSLETGPCPLWEGADPEKGLFSLPGFILPLCRARNPFSRVRQRGGYGSGLVQLALPMGDMNFPTGFPLIDCIAIRP
jgi:hypothetical protein